jgi:type I restriction enzyme R subunit
MKFQALFIMETMISIRFEKWIDPNYFPMYEKRLMLLNGYRMDLMEMNANMIDQSSLEFSELTRSQLPGLHLLQNLGYTYLSPREALALRGGRADSVLLESVLLDWLARNNEIQYHGQRYPFSEANIHTAVQVLKETLSIGLLRTNESIFNLLSLGKSLPQSVNGSRKRCSLRYIEWEHPEKNVYHVA